MSDEKIGGQIIEIDGRKVEVSLRKYKNSYRPYASFVESGKVWLIKENERLRKRVLELEGNLKKHKKECSKKRNKEVHKSVSKNKEDKTIA